MNWYEKLNRYFPVEDMKSEKQMELLLKEKGDLYHKDEGPNHILMYAEFADFIFIDYLLVKKEARGQRIGHQLINKLKQKNKPIILEVEPADYEDSDTIKRLNFYKREGFKHAESIFYEIRSLATKELNTWEILFWAPNGETEEMIYEGMKKTYTSIHTYKDKQVYGEAYEPVEDVLFFEDEEKE